MRTLGKDTPNVSKFHVRVIILSSETTQYRLYNLKTLQIHNLRFIKISLNLFKLINFITHRSVTLRLPRCSIVCTAITSMYIEFKEEPPTVAFQRWYTIVQFFLHFEARSVENFATVYILQKYISYHH